MKNSGSMTVPLFKWEMWSEIDPRWNREGEGETYEDCERRAQAKTTELKQLMGDPPDDLNWKAK